MDENNGVFASGQGYPADQTASFAQQQYQQQAPMASAQAAYTPQGYLAADQAQGVAPSVASVQSPTQDINPGLQQYDQVSDSANASWPTSQYAQPTQANPQQSALSSFDAFAQQDNQKIPISTDAYSFLSEPTDFNLAEKSSGAGGKKVLVVVIGVIALSILLGGTGFGAYTAGYQSGEVAGKRFAQNSHSLPSGTDEKPKTEDKKSTIEEPKLTFELIKPTFEEQELAGSLGEQLDLSDGLVLNVYNIDSKYALDSSDSSSDMQYVKIDIVLGNADNARSKTITGSSFKLMDEAGDVVEAMDTEAAGLDMAKSVTLSPGMKARLSVVFEVESFNSTSELVWSQTYQAGGQQRTVSAQVVLASSSSSKDTTLR